MAEQTVVAPEIQTPNTTESTRHHERYVAPPVDIHETREGLWWWQMCQALPKRP